ncbi:hypothetical protein ABW21_db0208901 [Orbilia brochopaga]|nr:hypothetical protein ABW21_db0208901 [Drechslerella brochopaga]
MANSRDKSETRSRSCPTCASDPSAECLSNGQTHAKNILVPHLKSQVARDEKKFLSSVTYVNRGGGAESSSQIQDFGERNQEQQFCHDVALQNADTHGSLVPHIHNSVDKLATLAVREEENAIVAPMRDYTVAMTTNTAGQACSKVVNTATGAKDIADTTVTKVEEAVYNTIEIAKSKLLTNPTIQDAVEQLRENFSPDSHEMAYKNYGISGAVQQSQTVATNTVRDIGWHRPTIEIPDPLVGGLRNGELFSRIRRFNKDVFDVCAIPLKASHGLDLNESWSDKHAADKLPLQLQRVYLSIILGMASFGKQVARLRSWKEKRRTSVFCVVYSLAWIFDLLVPLVLGTLIVVVSSKEARDYLFPPAPLALVDIGTGGIQKPQAGQLGTSNTLTGAPEKQEGEAAEEEAANFVNNVRHLIGRAVGMHEKEQAEGNPLEKKVPKPLKTIAKAVHEAHSTPGHAGDSKDLTQQPMEEILWDKANPEKLASILKRAPHVIGELVDNWERFANSISPTAPFSKAGYVRIDICLVPMLLTSFFVNYYMVYKGIGFALGIGIFGDPIIRSSIKCLNKNIPDWMELMEPKNNILRGIPTNNQLTLTLLRIGEANRAPIPPVPTSMPRDANQKQNIDKDDITFDATEAEIHQAIFPSARIDKPHSSQEEKQDPPKHKQLSKIMRILKGNTKAAVEVKLAVDHMGARVGLEKAKGHLGVLPKKKNLIFAGPSEYKARYDGKSGWVYLTDSAVVFSQKNQGDRSSPEVQILFNKIKRLKRATAFSIKAAEGVADWGNEKDLLGSIEIDGTNDHTWRFTALPERDALFNRLVAIGPQRWDNM